MAGESARVDTTKSNQAGAATHAAIHQANQQPKPEWLRTAEATRIFSICRSSLYELIAEGKIKSACLRKRGSLRGIRIISYDSLAEYCEQAASGGGAK